MYSSATPRKRSYIDEIYHTPARTPHAPRDIFRTPLQSLPTPVNTGINFVGFVDGHTCAQATQGRQRSYLGWSHTFRKWTTGATGCRGFKETGGRKGTVHLNGRFVRTSNVWSKGTEKSTSWSWYCFTLDWEGIGTGKCAFWIIYEVVCETFAISTFEVFCSNSVIKKSLFDSHNCR